MRDFLEDAHAHRQDGYGRAQAADKVPLMKRFYKAATVVPVEGEHAVLLDGKPVKTPGGKPVRVPTRALAEAMVEEWEAQQSHIDFRGMPLVRLAHSAVESGPEGAAAFRDEIVRFAGNDMMLYRADTPDSGRRAGKALGSGARGAGAHIRNQVPAYHRHHPPATA